MSSTKNKCRCPSMRWERPQPSCCPLWFSRPLQHLPRALMTFRTLPDPRHARCDQQDQLVTRMHLPSLSLRHIPTLLQLMLHFPSIFLLTVYNISPSFRYCFPHHLSSGKCSFIHSFVKILECLFHARHQVLSIHV